VKLFLGNMKNLALLLFTTLCCALVAQARPVPARFVLPDGQEVVGTFLELRADTVHYTVPSADTVQQLSVYKFDLKKVQLTETGALVDLSARDFQVTNEAPKDTTKVVAPTLKQGQAILLVQSNPPNARVYVDNILLDGLTPLVVPNIDGKKHAIMVREYLKGVDWWGTADVLPLPKAGDTTKVTIKLLKPHTQLKVQSIPTEAEIYIDEQPSLSHLPTMHSDTTLVDIRPGLERSVTFFKVGYYDTTVTLPVEAYMPNLVGIEMHAITDDLNKLQAQLDFVSHRKHKWVGRGLLYTSIAPLVAGAVTYALANYDWSKAADYKRSYEAAAFQSTATEGFIAQNKKYNNSGDTKAMVAGGLGGVALLLASVGLVLEF